MSLALHPAGHMILVGLSSRLRLMTVLEKGFRQGRAARGGRRVAVQQHERRFQLSPCEDCKCC